MATQIMRIRKANTQTLTWDVLHPETSSMAVLRPEGGLQEDYNLLYDDHIIDSAKHIYRCTATGTSSTISVSLPDVILVDQLALIIKLRMDLSAEPVLSFNGEPHANIIGSDGANVMGGQITGSSIVVVWLEGLQKWLLVNNDLDGNTTHAVVPVVSYYSYTAQVDGENTIPVTGYVRGEDKLDVNYEQTILQPGVDYTTLQDNSILLLNGHSLLAGEVLFCTITKYVETIRRGFRKFTLQTSNVKVNITEESAIEVPVPEFGDTDYELVVNLNQTILREDIDYKRDYARKTMVLLDGRRFVRGDVIVFTISRYIEELGSVGNLMPSIGSYQTIVKPIYESFTADQDDTVRIIVPSYDPYRDDLAVVLDNLVLVGDGVDYSTTTSGEIVLLTRKLSAGDVIYFRILKGMKMETTPYTIINGGGDGKDILVSISDGSIWDNYTLAIKMPADMEEAPTVKLLDGPARTIYDNTGDVMHAGSVVAGAYLLIIYNEGTDTWYAMNTNKHPAEEEEGTAGTNGIATMSLMSRASGTANNGATEPLASGIANFCGKANKILARVESDEEDPIGYYETVIAHNLGFTPTDYHVTPCEPPSTLEENGERSFTATIGDIWVDADDMNLYVGNSGTATSTFKWVIYR